MRSFSQNFLQKISHCETTRATLSLLIDDRALLDAFRRGDPQALERVYRHYVRVVAGVLRQGGFTGYGVHLYGAPREEWRDLIQETFARAFSESTRLRYDGLRPYEPYLLAIARHALADYWRGRGRQRKLRENTPPELAAEAPDPEHLALTAAASAFAKSLSGEPREIYEQRFARGHSQLDAASALAITRQRVRTVEKRLLAEFRRFLQRTKKI
jgi:RNA polymerase sigma-70 factor (ECF subfamily)